MSDVIDMATIAALVGDPARANILCALLDGRALTAGELAYAARVSPPTTSGHLNKLLAAKLIALAQQGRHRYYRLAGPHIAAMLETIMNVASFAPPRLRPSHIAKNLRRARMCYDHVAGQLGVAIADALQANGAIELSDEGGEVTRAGEAFLLSLGINARSLSSRRAFCRPCLDWSERRPHLAGALGAAITERLIALGWIERVRDGRALVITVTGTRGLRDKFGILLDDVTSPQHRHGAHTALRA